MNIFKRISFPKIREISEKNLELSVDELWERALGEKEDDGRSLDIVTEIKSVKYVPSQVTQRANKLLEEGKLEICLRYITNAFYIYRESVASGENQTSAPHYLNNGAYEWPDPAHFSWEDNQTVIEFGQYVYDPNHKDIKIEVKKDDGIESMSIIPIIGPDNEIIGSLTKEELRPLIIGKDDLSSRLKYKIPDLNKVGFIFQQSWQQLSLRAYANPIYWILHDFSNNKLSKDETTDHLKKHLENLEKTYDLPVARYKRKNEKASSGSFFFWV